MNAWIDAVSCFWCVSLIFVVFAPAVELRTACGQAGDRGGWGMVHVPVCFKESTRVFPAIIYRIISAAAVPQRRTGCASTDAFVGVTMFPRIAW